MSQYVGSSHSMLVMDVQGAARQEVQDSVAQGGVETQGFELNDEFGGYYGVKSRAVVDEQHSYLGIPLVQMGQGSVIALSVDLLGR